MTTALEGGEVSESRPGRSLPPGKTRYPFYRRLGGPQGRSGQARKISPPTGIRYPDRPTRSQLLYRLSYTDHNLYLGEGTKTLYFSLIEISQFDAIFLACCHKTPARSVTHGFAATPQWQVKGINVCFGTVQGSKEPILSLRVKLPV